MCIGGICNVNRRAGIAATSQRKSTWRAASELLLCGWIMQRFVLKVHTVNLNDKPLNPCICMGDIDSYHGCGFRKWNENRQRGWWRTVGQREICRRRKFRRDVFVWLKVSRKSFSVQVFSKYSFILYRGEDSFIGKCKISRERTLTVIKDRKDIMDFMPLFNHFYDSWKISCLFESLVYILFQHGQFLGIYGKYLGL